MQKNLSAVLALVLGSIGAQGFGPHPGFGSGRTSGGGGGGGGVSPPTVACTSAGELAYFSTLPGTQLECTDIVWDKINSVLSIPDAGNAPAASLGFGQLVIDQSDGILKIRKSTGDGGALVSLEAGGVSATFEQNSFTPGLGQTVFALSTAYVGAGGLSRVSVNTTAGYVEGVHYTISGTTLTWLDPFTLDGSDSVVVIHQTN